ncbi:MAG: exodeoxyribonuclease VII small subunit [Fibrobacterota bacterium]
MTQKSDDFEAAFTELESCSAALESQELSLEASLDTFEKGLRAAAACRNYIEAGEQRVVNLVEELDDPAIRELMNQDSENRGEEV